MFSEKVESQEFARKILNNHIVKNRLSHTYLFTGNPGSGKEDLAVAFACALNSEAENPFGDDYSLSSQKILGGKHPDVILIGEDEKARSIKIEEVRNVLGQASLKPYEGKRKVFIFKKAERLTLDAANALLKILEEPPEQTVFILLVDTRGHLLETIGSRSFEVRLKPLGSIDMDLGEGLPPEGLGVQSWEDFFESYEKSTRDEMKDLFDHLLKYFRKRLIKGSEGEALEKSPTTYLKAIDYVVETKEAIMANANQKLALTRLMMQLKRINA